MSASSPVPDFSSLRVVVVGDPIVDHYLFTRPTRMSREAPVMVMRHEGDRIGPGGAANVARNVRTLGARTELIGAVGRDARGRELLELLQEDGIEVEGLPTVADWATPTKTRILGAEPGRTMHQVLRIDREPDGILPVAVRVELADRLRSLAGKVDAVLVSDYGYGLVGEEVARAAGELREAGAVVVLDPRQCFAPFRGASAMTPNLGELAVAVERIPADLATQDDVTRAAGDFLALHAPRLLLVTMGNRGMALYSDEHPRGIAIPSSGSKDVVDVSGAGDTAAAAFTLALAAGLEPAIAMRMANAASGVVVMETGATVCPLDALRSALSVSPRPDHLPAPVSG